MFVGAPRMAVRLVVQGIAGALRRLYKPFLLKALQKFGYRLADLLMSVVEYFPKLQVRALELLVARRAVGLTVWDGDIFPLGP